MIVDQNHLEWLNMRVAFWKDHHCPRWSIGDDAICNVQQSFVRSSSKKRFCHQVDFKGNGISIKIQHNKIWKKVFKERSVECVGSLIQFDSTEASLIKV